MDKGVHCRQQQHNIQGIPHDDLYTGTRGSKVLSTNVACTVSELGESQATRFLSLPLARFGRFIDSRYRRTC